MPAAALCRWAVRCGCRLLLLLLLLLLNTRVVFCHSGHSPPGSVLLPLQAAIGASGAAAFDLTAACSGFVMALVTGSQYIRAGTYKNVLVIGAGLVLGSSTAVWCRYSTLCCNHLVLLTCHPPACCANSAVVLNPFPSAAVHPQARMRCLATLTGGTAPRASCLATAAARWC